MSVMNNEPQIAELSAEAEAVTSAEPPTADMTRRLAEEFIVLAEEFPHLTRPDQLPKAVLDTAAEQGIPLLDAYLRYRLQEEKKVATAAQQQRQAACRSAGSLSRGAVQTPPEQDAFLRAFRAAL